MSPSVGKVLLKPKHGTQLGTSYFVLEAREYDYWAAKSNTHPHAHPRAAYLAMNKEGNEPRSFLLHPCNERKQKKLKSIFLKYTHIRIFTISTDGKKFRV